MRDEPENERRGGSMLRVNEIHLGKAGTPDAAPDGRVHGGQSGGRVADGSTGGGARLHRDGAENAALPALEQRPAWHRAVFSGQGDGAQPGSVDAPVGPMAAHQTGGRTTEVPPLFPRTIHGCRRESAGGGGCRTRRSIRPGGAAHSAARVSDIRQKRIPAFSRDFGVPFVQPAAFGALPKSARRGAPYAGPPDLHRRTAQARSARPPGVSARGYGSSGQPGWASGPVPHQRRGHGHAMAGGGLRGDHFRTSLDPGSRSHVASVSVPHPGLSLRQRLGVPQLHSCQAAQQAAGGVHQVAALSHHRQRSGRGQEWRGDPQAYRLRSHRRPTRRGVPKILHRLLQLLSQLPPSLRLRHARDRGARKAPALLSRRGLPYSLRETRFAPGLESVLETGHHRRVPVAPGDAHERHRSSPTNAKSQTHLAGQVSAQSVNAFAGSLQRWAGKGAHSPPLSPHPYPGSKKMYERRFTPVCTSTILKFQAHPALESNLAFRLTSGLENAGSVQFGRSRSELRLYHGVSVHYFSYKTTHPVGILGPAIQFVTTV